MNLFTNSLKPFSLRKFTQKPKSHIFATHSAIFSLCFLSVFK